MKYVTSDIHGRLDRLKKLIDLIKLSKEDTLYIIGDLVDRGRYPIETIQYVMNHPQIKVIMGNHDEMMLHTLKYKDKIQEERWSRNRNETTLKGFYKLSKEEQNEILEYLDSLPYYKIVDNKYLLVHGGFEPTRLKEDMKTMNLKDALNRQKNRLVWVRDDFLKNKGLENLITIFGHSTRKYIDKSLGVKSILPYEIWFDKRFNDKIGMDTANCYDGRMSCLRLEDMEVFYIE